MLFDERHDTWATSNRFVPRTFVRPLYRFSQIEAASGLALLVAAAVALIWANSPLADSYHHLFEEVHLEISLGAFHFEESLGHFINDGLMALFFFVVGLEIKREMVLGDLSNPKAAALPVVAALGGMIVPALIYLAFTSGAGGEATRGWGIPMATDIAFAVGVISLLGRRVPAGGKLFILALAIADDIGAIAVIAVFYTTDLRALWLVGAVIGLGLIWFGQRSGVRSLIFYVPFALFVWFATLESGVHATLAGVVMGLLTPARAWYSATELDTKARMILDTYPIGKTILDEERADHEAMLLAEIANESVAPLNRLEHRLLPWSSFVIVPLFALANAGVTFSGTPLGGILENPVALGVGLGLLVGKPIGITLFAWLAVRSGIGRLPPHTTWSHIVGLGSLAGIGFTVSLFVTGLAFTSDEFTGVAKIGIFAGSLLAGIVGSTLLVRSRREPIPMPAPAEVPA
ncbi:MAG TPA: Na+/H+ antiporter NhaA [Acidimicrobiia bacterium]|nr:Na+/H+ antiporter NhaA [Acidimicrobiia bacterium]